MTSSRERPPETSSARHGPSRAPGRAPSPARAGRRGRAARPRPVAAPPPADGPEASAEACPDLYLDGLFTYCLSVMCEHDAATAALGEALALAERQHQRGRRPAGADRQRSWLYALARWVCLRRLAEQRRRDGRDGPAPAEPRATGPQAEQRRRELAALAWPEAAGTAPAQREALELAVRHQLSAAEVGRVLRISAEDADTLLTGAACEVERARGALAAVRAGACPLVGVLAGEDRLLMAPGLRRELLRHVDECPLCRRVAQRALSGDGWPGTAPSTERLTVLPAPRAAVHAARLAAARARAQHHPRFDRAGFPLDERDRAARRDRLRSRAVTTTVVATVLAAPVLALWAAYRGAPTTGEAGAGPAAATDNDHDGDAYYDYPYENAGRADDSPGDGRTPDAGPDRETEEAEPGHGDRRRRGSPPASPTGDGTGPGVAGLAVTAEAAADGTRITLTATGDAPVRWRASADVPWLLPSRTEGRLAPGERVTLLVPVDREREPAGPWRGRITIAPTGSVVTIEGHGPGGGTTDPTPTDPEPGPSDPDPGPSDPDPDPEPTDPDPDPDPGPTDPEPTEPDPDPSPSDPSPENSGIRDQRA